MLDRRKFVISGATLSATHAASSIVRGQDAGGQSSKNPRTVRVGVMGLSRGQSLAYDLAQLENVEITYLCDIDTSRTKNVRKQLEAKTGQASRVVGDFREILDDPDVDVLVCAAPNHWHGPATIMACKEGKHVYVEKPCSHNPQEGEWMVKAAREYGRCVQMGTQRRSAAGTRAGIEKLHSGAIGSVHLARCYYNNLRGSIGKGRPGEPPATVDYELWQGPAPRKAFRTNYLHYNWHWFWHWGGGELANNGVHALDLCRWGLDVTYPIRTVSSGGRYWYDDDQETPDVQSACFEFEQGKQITWDALSCNKHRVDFFCCFYGTQGTLELDSDGQFRIYDRNDKLIEKGEESSVGQVEHLQNFIDCVRSNSPEKLNQPILDGHRSTLLCHLGNIAYRTGQTVLTDSETGHLLTSADANQTDLWRREYDPNWATAVRMD